MPVHVAILGEGATSRAPDRDSGDADEVAALVAGLLVPGGFAVVNRPLDNPLLDTALERPFGGPVAGRVHPCGQAPQTEHGLDDVAHDPRILHDKG